MVSMIDRQSELINKLNRKLVEAEETIGRLNAVMTRKDVTRP
jgi:hypothetical protein